MRLDEGLFQAQRIEIQSLQKERTTSTSETASFTQDGNTGARKMRRYTSAMPLNVVSSAGSRPRIEANHVILDEIREINQRLIDTGVDISDEDVDPTADGCFACEKAMKELLSSAISFFVALDQT
ncbi:Mediator of RNA polymerase II transcription subunit 15a [Camellia lanceoleosa]|uniref:Mediator of RNA polymerase II transcription subunit 15a n=1 Tax=Camellia lanceoleosa TaxID=1840588 RepID=A0ACC0G0P9_9ERIC|nr:Mediator of RNA polymerase II transcription subunit 15a [Camellia lanceoleosa]